MDRKKSLTRQVIATGEMLIFPDVSQDTRVNRVLHKRGIQSMIAIPLKLERKVIGVLYLNDVDLHDFTEIEVSLLSSLANQAAIAINNIRLFDSRVRDLQIVNKVVQVISTKLDTEDLLQTIVSQIAEELDCTHCTLFLLQEEDSEWLLVPQETHGVRAEIMTRRFQPDKGLIGWVFKHGESLVLDTAMDDPRFAPARDPQDRPRSMLVAPIKVGDQTIGVISADQDEFGWFGENEQRLVDALALQAGIAIERAQGLALLQDIGNRIISVQKEDEILLEIVSGAIELTNTASGVIHLISEDEKSVIKSLPHPPGFDHPKPRMDNDKGLVRRVIKTGHVLIFPDISQATSVSRVLHDQGIRSTIAIPLKHEQKVVGVLNLNDTDLHDFTETEVSLLSLLANQAAIAIKNAQDRVAELTALSKLGDDLAALEQEIESG